MFDKLSFRALCGALVCICAIGFHQQASSRKFRLVRDIMVDSLSVNVSNVIANQSSLSHVSNSTTRVGICITGEPRNFLEMHRNIHRHILEPIGSYDIFMYVPAGAWPSELVDILKPKVYKEGPPGRQMRWWQNPKEFFEIISTAVMPRKEIRSSIPYTF